MVNFFKQTVLFGVSVTVIFILSEYFIRITHIFSPSSMKFSYDIGLTRNNKETTYLKFNEGFGLGKINKYGYIGESISPHKNTNTIRIILLGDSYVESFQVFDRHYFGNIAEQYLTNKFPHKNIEILNFGMSGFDIFSMYTYHQKFAKKFNPDYILYMISIDDLEPRSETAYLNPKPFVENDSIKSSSQYIINYKKKSKFKLFLCHKSAIFNMLASGMKKAREVSLSAVLFEKIHFWFKPKTNALPSEIEKEYEFQINPVTKKIICSFDTNNIILINRGSKPLPLKIKELCLKKGLMYKDLSQVLQKMKENGHDPNKWKGMKGPGHWNHKAHKTIGNEIGILLNDFIRMKVSK